MKFKHQLTVIFMGVLLFCLINVVQAASANPFPDNAPYSVVRLTLDELNLYDTEGNFVSSFSIIPDSSNVDINDTAFAMFIDSIQNTEIYDQVESQTGLALARAGEFTMAETRVDEFSAQASLNKLGTTSGNIHRNFTFQNQNVQGMIEIIGSFTWDVRLSRQYDQFAYYGLLLQFYKNEEKGNELFYDNRANQVTGSGSESLVIPLYIEPFDVIEIDLNLTASATAIDMAPVPVPGSAFMLLSGIAVLIMVKNKRYRIKHLQTGQ